MMHKRLLTQRLSRRPFCLLGAKSTGKTTLLRDFAAGFSNWILLDLETAADRTIFNFNDTHEETLRAISFLKGKEIRGKGTLIILDEIHKCPEAARWVSAQAEWRTGAQADGPLVVAASSVMTDEVAGLTDHGNGIMKPLHLFPFSFEEFLMTLGDAPALEAFREVPVPFYAYDKLLNYFHLYALIGGMPEITAEYAANHHLSGLKKIYEHINDRFMPCISEVTAGLKSRDLASEVFQNAYPYAATRISFNRFGNLEKGSREIGNAFKALERAFLLQMILPVTSAKVPLAPDTSKFPRLQLVDTGLVNYFSGIQKPLFQSHDMNAIFEGQVARQAVGQEILATVNPREQDGMPAGLPGFYHHPSLNFWVRNKAQSTAEVDFVMQYRDLVIPVVVKSGEPGRLRSLHQFIDSAPHAFAVRLHAGNLAVQQTRTIGGKQFFLLNLPYFLAGKIREHLEGFMKYVEV